MKTTAELIQAWREGTITLAEVQTLFDEESREFVEVVSQVKRCKVRLIHTEHGIHIQSRRCVLPANHQEHDSDHRDKHGCRAPVLVSQATIREVARVSSQQQRDEDQEVFNRAHNWAGQMLSFDIAPNGDVVLVATVPSEGLNQQVRLSAQELAGLAEASRNKREL